MAVAESTNFLQPVLISAQFLCSPILMGVLNLPMGGAFLSLEAKILALHVLIIVDVHI